MDQAITAKEEQLPVSQTAAFMSVIERMAVNPDVDPDKIGKLLDQQERIIDKNSKMAFNKAMTACQATMPSVVKDALNKQTNSTYAKYETITRTIKPVYTEHGFSLSFGTDKSPLEGHIRITCEVMHSEGHCKDYFVDLPPDLAGIKGTVNKTGIHGSVSTYSYGKRCLATMIFNIAVADQDDDAVKAGAVTVQDLLEYNGLVCALYQSIATIKMGIGMSELSRAAEAWFELDDNEKRDLWRAPTKGGIFTTIERQVIHSQAFREAHYGTDGNENSN